MADTDLADLRKQCITSLYLCTDNVSKYLDSEKEAEFDKLKKCVQQYCTLEAQQDVTIEAMEKAKRETDTSNVDTLEERFQSHLSTLVGKRLRVDKHPYMIEFTKRFEKGLEAAKHNLDESELAITESQDQYLDPITKRPIADPVKNTVCGHVYERESIMNLIKTKSRTKCPVAGCGNRAPVVANQLVSDEELMFRMTITKHSTMIQERTITNLDDTTG
ncbi:E3 SUMO-protein ligase NSE2-like [Trichoplusia ni]|uniref:E3 SUMO-protein ligase NSE2 n=1 Tax=Trichoplusia ni TaxID=7111 RepID=A0A7E5VN88_TRINI|nr:E3 SUMO-protein ligase NSE2-like [Trichoplusia ni]